MKAKSAMGITVVIAMVVILFYLYGNNANSGTRTVQPASTALTTTANIAPVTLQTTIGQATVTTTVSPFTSSTTHLYVANYYSGNLSIINTTSSTPANTSVSFSSRPYYVAATPDGKYIYVTQSNNTVAVINTSIDRITGVISTGMRPSGIAISADGRYAYVIMSSGNTSKVYVFNSKANTIAGRILIPGSGTSYNLAVTPDGRYLYVINGNNTLSVINTSVGKVTGTINVNPLSNVAKNGECDGCLLNIGIAVSPDSKYVYVTNTENNTLFVINVLQGDVVNTIHMPGSAVYGVAITPDGRFLYVVNYLSDSVSVLDTTSNRIVGTIMVGNTPIAIAISPNGSRAYVANYNSATVSVINTTTNNVTGTIGVGIEPVDVETSP